MIGSPNDNEVFSEKSSDVKQQPDSVAEEETTTGQYLYTMNYTIHARTYDVMNQYIKPVIKGCGAGLKLMNIKFDTKPFPSHKYHHSEWFLFSLH